MFQDRDYYFIIYGGGSDVIQMFIKSIKIVIFCQSLKKHNQLYKLGDTISTNEIDWFKRFDNLLGKWKKRS